MPYDFTYDEWMNEQGIPVHRGYYIEDLRTIELSPWDLRECNSAFIQLEGMPGVVEGRVQEIPPGSTIKPFKSAVDELVYVLNGQGTTSVWGSNAASPHTFEWSARSLFLIPRNSWAQFSNMQGDRVVRLLHYNYMPLAMSAIPDPEFLLNNPFEQPLPLPSQSEMYSEAQAVTQNHIAEGQAGRTLWLGNFFPDMAVWDKLMHRPGRGSMNRSVYMKAPGSELRAHMSVFPAGTYKKGHRHGPGRVIVIPGGEGYSIMWPEGEEKVVIPWHEASCFVPPNRWFHQHFNVGANSGRYLALHPPNQFAGYGEKVEDRARDQIEYPDEENWIREKFESELSTRGLTSAMPDEAYRNPDYTWDYKGVPNA